MIGLNPLPTQPQGNSWFGSLDPSGVALPASLRKLSGEQPGPPPPNSLHPEQGLQLCRQSRAASFLCDQQIRFAFLALTFPTCKGEKPPAPPGLLWGAAPRQGEEEPMAAVCGRARGRVARPERGGPGRPGFVAWIGLCRPGLGRLFH